MLRPTKDKKSEKERLWPEVKSSPEKTKRKRQRAGRVAMVMERPPTLPNSPERVNTHTVSGIFLAIMLEFKTKGQKNKSSPPTSSCRPI